MAEDQDVNLLPGGPNIIPPLPVLQRRSQRPPPAIPLRQFRSNPNPLSGTASPDLESVDLESSNLGSTTSESGKLSKQHFYLWGSRPRQSATEKDKLEQYLDQFETLDSRIVDLLHDYSRLKNKLSPELFEVFSYLVQLNVFQPFQNQPHIQHLSYQLKHPLCTNRWSDLRSDLKVGESVLTVCMISSTVNDDVKNIFSFKDKIFVTTGRLKRKYKAPSLSLLFIVAEEWALPKEVLTSCMSPSSFRRRMFTPFTTFSIKRQSTSFTLNNPDWISMDLYWHSKVPHYEPSFWDFNIYIWRPQIDGPETEQVKLFINNVSDHGWQLLMLWRPAERNSRTALDKYTQRRMNEMQKHFNSPHSSETETISSLFSLYALIIDDTDTFLDSLLDEIAYLTLQGRRKPTASKINFLLHLDDYRQESCIGLRDASSLLEEISSWMNANPDKLDAEHGFEMKLQSWCDEIRRDIKRLQAALVEIKDALVNVQTMTKDQIDFQQLTLTAILTFLAAIYLPFSLISGMFGMNVKDPLFLRYPKPSNGANSSSQASAAKFEVPVYHITHRVAVAATLSSDIGVASTSLASSATSVTGLSNFSQAQTDEIVSAINELSSSPSPHLWSFAQFLYLSVALSAATIVLPIIAGPIFRYTLRSFYRSKVYWRVGVFGFALTSTIVLDVYIPPLPFDIIFGAPQVFYACYKLAEARFRSQQKKRWSGYATLLAVCTVTDFEVPGAQNARKFIHYGHNVGLTAFLPPLYLFVIWMQTEPPLLSNSRLLSWKTRVFSTSPRLKAQLLKIPHMRKSVKVYTVSVIIGINTALSYFLPGLIYPVATTIPFGLYTVDKCMTSWVVRKDIKHSMLLFLVVGASFFLEFTTLGYFVGISALGPSTYLWAYHYRHEIRAQVIRLWSASNRIRGRTT